MIKLFQPHMPAEVNGPLLDTLHSGYVTQGPRVDEFEKLWGEYIGNSYAVSVNSGTAALTLALRLAGVEKGSEVITTPMTCSATNLPILSLGGVPVFADIDPVSGLIDPESVAKLITPKTKAIMCVDWGGMPCDLDALTKIAHSNGLKLIEDAAHAIGAEYKGKKVGNYADFTCFSFQAIKHITTGDGGMLMVRKKEDYDQAKLLRWFGISRDSSSKDTRIEEDIKDWGYKFHMNDIAATIGIEQMKHIERVVATYRMNAYFYQRNLPEEIQAPKDQNTKSSFWLYTLVFPNKVIRDLFKDYMIDKGVQVSQVHKRNDSYSVFKPYAKTSLFNTQTFNNTMACIPVHHALTGKDLVNITRIVNNFINEYRGYL
jgi:perosamine synthetase